MKNGSKSVSYWFVLSAQIFLIVLSAFMEGYLPLAVIFVIALLYVYGTIIATMWRSKFPRIIAIIAGILAVVGGFCWIIEGVTDDMATVGMVISVLSFSIVVILAIEGIARDVFTSERVTGEVIVGSVCVYLLLGLLFAFIYSAIGLTMPDGFNMGGETAMKIEDFKDYVYFSFMTITTTGFGDMIPLRSLPRLFVIMEMIVGPLYLAILVARLVSMHTAQRLTKKA